MRLYFVAQNCQFHSVLMSSAMLKSVFFTWQWLLYFLFHLPLQMEDKIPCFFWCSAKNFWEICSIKPQPWHRLCIFVVTSEFRQALNAHLNSFLLSFIMSNRGPLLGLWVSIQYKYACRAALCFSLTSLFHPGTLCFCLLVILVCFSATPGDAGERGHYGGISSPVLSKGKQRGRS